MEYRTIPLICLCWTLSCSNNPSPPGGLKNASSSQGGKVGRSPGKPALDPAAAAPVARSSMPQLSGPHHPVFSLADNRTLAHLMR